MMVSIIRRAQSYGIAVVAASLGCVLAHCVAHLSVSILDRAVSMMSLPRTRISAVVLFLMLSGVVARIFLSKENNKRVLKSLDPRLIYCSIINLFLVAMCAFLVKVADKVIMDQSTVLAKIRNINDCLNKVLETGCKNINQLKNHKSTVDNLYSILVGYKYVMLLLVAVSIMAAILATLCSVIAIYKVWMAPKFYRQDRIEERRKVVPGWYTKMTFYSIAFVVLIFIVLQVFDSLVSVGIGDDQGIKLATTFALGIFGIIEGSILLSFSRDLYNFVFVEDWQNARKSDSVAMVSRDLIKSWH